jgi:hypothetical protein
MSFEVDPIDSPPILSNDGQTVSWDSLKASLNFRVAAILTFLASGQAHGYPAFGARISRFYSSRNVLAGSICAILRVGRVVASRVANTTVNTTAARVGVS